jgi:hypothetical protein
MRVRNPGRAIGRGLAAWAICTAMAMLVSGCSSNYPAVLANPTPRDDPTMTPDQVKQATDNLISDRNQLSTQVQAAQAAAGADGALAPAAAGAPPAGAPAKP